MDTALSQESYYCSNFQKKVYKNFDFKDVVRADFFGFAF